MSEFDRETFPSAHHLDEEHELDDEVDTDLDGEETGEPDDADADED